MADFGIKLAAIKGTQGGREFYSLNVPNPTFSTIFSSDEPAVERSQRPFDPKHARKIEEYMEDNPDSFVLGAITYAIDRPAAFEPLPGQDESSGPVCGIMTIPLGAKFRSLDGQHRRAALQEVLDSEDETAFQGMSTSVLIYVEPDLDKRRQMFSDMNSTPRKVSTSLNVSFDSRNPFSRCAVALSESNPLLLGRVEMHSPRVKADSDYFFSLASVQDALKRLFSRPGGRVKKPSLFPDELILGRGEAFFDLLYQTRPEFREAQVSKQGLQALRETTVLFSSTTLRVIAGSVYLQTVGDMKQYDLDMQQQVFLAELHKCARGLETFDFSTQSKDLISVGFIAAGKSTPSARNQEVQAATTRLSAHIKACA